MPTMTKGRDGHPWKAYGNGKVLCAALRPFHDALKEDGTCDCATRESETIATYTLKSGKPKR